MNIILSPPNDDYRAFLAFARDTDREYAETLTRTVKRFYPGRNVVFSCNGAAYNSYGAPNADNIGLYSPFDFWMSEVGIPNPSQLWFFTLNNYSKEYGKKYVTTSNKPGLTPEDYRRIIAGNYAVGVNYIVPWDMYVASSATNLRYFAKKEDMADLYGYIRGMSPYLDGYEDAYAASAVVVPADAVNDARLAGSYANIPPVKIDSAHEKLYAFARAKPGDVTAPVAVHVVDWSAAPQASTVTVDRSRFFPGKQLDIQWLTPKSYDATLHETAQTTKNYSLLVASGAPPYSWNGLDTVKIFLPPATPWGTLVVRPVAINPPVNVRVLSTEARGAQFEYDANDNPAGTEYRIFLSSTGANGTYFQVLSSTSLTPWVAGLIPNTTYHARVRAVQPGGALSWSAAMAGSFRTLKEDGIAPGAPPSLTATLIEAGRGRLAWDGSVDNVGVTRYALERCVGAACSTFVQIATLPVVGAVTVVDKTTFPERLTLQWSGGGQFKNVVKNQKVSVQATTYTLTTDSTVGNLYLPKTAPVSVGDEVAFLSPLTTEERDLASSRVYRYRLRAEDAAGNISVPSPVADLTTPAAGPANASSIDPNQETLIRGVNVARVFPNPYRSGRGAQGITIDRLPEETIIRLFSIDGRPVKTLTTSPSGSVLWDLTNDDGSPVTSGTYVVLIEKNGSNKRLKVVVQK